MRHRDSEREFGENTLIEELRGNAYHWGWDLEATISGEFGNYALKYDTGEDILYCTAKEYMYREMASFPKPVVLRAVDHKRPLVIFFGEDPMLGSAYVFRPDVVKEEGVPNTQQVPLPKRAQWLDISIDRGVILGDYVSGRKTLPR